jgi:hypothetical protein
MAEGEGRENMHHGGRWGWRPANNLWRCLVCSCDLAARHRQKNWIKLQCTGTEK